jgi:hypothetical protein
VRPLVFVAGAVLVLLMLAEFFTTFLVPRRVRRDPRIARRIVRIGWRGYRRAARLLPAAAADTMLGFYGPAIVLVLLVTWTIGLVIGFAAMQWASGSNLSSGHGVSFGDDLYFSGGGFLSAEAGLAPEGALSRVLFILEAACGFAVLFIAIGYLPALFQAFSRREVAISQLDPRAGSPPSAGALIERSAALGGWESLDAYLGEWEQWSAELMETHLSYPSLAYYRSQHLNQNWLAALTTVLDASAFALAAADSARPPESAEVTYATGRHALADIALMLRTKPRLPDPPRLDDQAFHQLWELAENSGLELRDPNEAREQLHELRKGYEPFAASLAAWLELALPSWLPSPKAEANWRRAVLEARRRRGSEL